MRMEGLGSQPLLQPETPLGFTFKNEIGGLHKSLGGKMVLGARKKN